MLSCNCPKCGKFATTFRKEQIGKNMDLIFKCKKCNITYGRSVGSYLAVHGDIEFQVSEIQENSPRWIELMGVEL